MHGREKHLLVVFLGTFLEGRENPFLCRSIYHIPVPTSEWNNQYFEGHDVTEGPPSNVEFMRIRKHCREAEFRCLSLLIFCFREQKNRDNWRYFAREKNVRQRITESFYVLPMSCQKKLGNPIWVCYSLASELEMTQYSLFMYTNPTLVPFEANLLYRVRRSNANFAFIL